VALARNEAGRQGSAEANGRSSLKAPKSVRAAEKFSRTRLSQSFFMRDFLFSEIAAIEGLSVFYNRPGRCREMRAFSGLHWKTHVLGEASEIAKKRNCSE
jgi:hypothetical protein